MSKRKFRSDTAAEDDTGEAFALEDTTVMRTPEKAKKGVVRYLCSSCDVERTARAFPDYNPSSECDHLINTCKACLKAWVNVQIESAQFATGGEDGKSFGVKVSTSGECMRTDPLPCRSGRWDADLYQCPPFPALMKNFLMSHQPRYPSHNSNHNSESTFDLCCNYSRFKLIMN